MTDDFIYCIILIFHLIFMQNSIDFKQIISSEGAVLYQSSAGQLKYSNSGCLSIYLSFDGLILLKINQFQYGITPQSTIKFSTSDPQYRRVLYLKKYPDGVWILKLNDNYSFIQSLIRQKCNLQNNNSINCRQGSRNQQLQPPLKQNQQKQQEQQQKPQSTKKKSIQVNEVKEQNPAKKKFNFGRFVKSTAKILSKGLTISGNFLSKQFQNTGQYIAKKVQPKQNIEVSQNAQKNLQLAMTTTKTVLKFTSTQVGNLFNFGLKMASDIGERMEDTDTGKELKESKYYQPAKSAGKTTVVALSNIYEGVWNAAYSVGSGIANGSTKIIQKKYGQQIGDAADNIFESTGNAVKLTRVANDQLAAVLKQ